MVMAMAIGVVFSVASRRLFSHISFYFCIRLYYYYRYAWQIHRLKKGFLVELMKKGCTCRRVKKYERCFDDSAFIWVWILFAFALILRVFWPSILLFVVMSTDWCAMSVLINLPKIFGIAKRCHEVCRQPFYFEESPVVSRTGQLFPVSLSQMNKMTFAFQCIFIWTNRFSPPLTTSYVEYCIQIHIQKEQQPPWNAIGKKWVRYDRPVFAIVFQCSTWFRYSFSLFIVKKLFGLAYYSSSFWFFIRWKNLPASIVSYVYLFKVLYLSSIWIVDVQFLFAILRKRIRLFTFFLMGLTCKRYLPNLSLSKEMRKNGARRTVCVQIN